MKEKVIKLPKELTIYTVSLFWKTLYESIENMNKLKDEKLILYFEKLEKIDGAGIQLLLSLEKTILKEGLKIEYIKVKEPIRELFQSVGVDYLLVVEGEENE
ncbi:MAG: STAS domain-containing protein [Bacillota bacterium]